MKKYKWKKWRYRNTALLILSLILFFYFSDKDFFQNFIRSVGALGYFGSFISGLFFVSIFTVAPASVILFDISRVLDPYLVAFFAGLGAVAGDYFILKILKDKVFEELLPVFRKTSKSFLGTIFASPFFVWLIPLFGAVIIASPLPDEVGIGLMGISKIKNWQFLLITFLLNFLGILIVITLANSF